MLQTGISFGLQRKREEKLFIFLLTDRFYHVYFSVSVPSFLANINNPLHAISTGIASKCASGLTRIVLKTPFPAATVMPGGPFNESTHPKQRLIKSRLIRCNRLKTHQ